MAATTITEYSARPCIKCGGKGRIAAFQHRKGGECFRCGATGNYPVMIETTRGMSDDEVIAALAGLGFTVQGFADIVPAGFGGLFLSDEQAATIAEVMNGARAALAAI